MTELSLMGFLAALLTGCACGIFLESEAAYRKPRCRAKKGSSKVRLSASKLIALCVLAVDGSATYAVLYLCLPGRRRSLRVWEWCLLAAAIGFCVYGTASMAL